MFPTADECKFQMVLRVPNASPSLDSRERGNDGFWSLFVIFKWMIYQVDFQWLSNLVACDPHVERQTVSRRIVRMLRGTAGILAHVRVVSAFEHRLRE